jgi:hypothetical protein
MPRPRDINLRMAPTAPPSRQADGSYRVTDGAAAFTIANRDFNTRSYRTTWC